METDPFDFKPKVKKKDTSEAERLAIEEGRKERE